MAGVEDVLVEILQRGLPKSEAQRQLLIEAVKGKAQLPSQGAGEESDQQQQQERPTTRSSSR